MTEAEWLACTDLKTLLKRLRKKSQRKLRLLAVACCRRIWHLFTQPDTQDAIRTAECYADGLTSQGKVIAARKRIKQAAREVARNAGDRQWQPEWSHPYSTALELVILYPPRFDCPGIAYKVALEVATADGEPEWWRNDNPVWAAEGRAHCHLGRDIFKSPFRPVTLDPTSLTPLVVSLAQAAYEERSLPSGELDATRLTVLADALEEAGCDNADILNHCKGPGPHVCGCWVVDLLLGKE
jgi:hypothetical protein